MSSLVLGMALTLVGAEGNYKLVKPVVFESEKKGIPDIWVLDFNFRIPRYTMVEVPGKGRKLIWYMTYKVVNRSDKPRHFYPHFTIVTEEGKKFDDVVLPAAQRTVIAREDPSKLTLADSAGDPNQTRWLNSVTMSKEPIPPTPAESLPEVRQGVCFWEDVDMKTKSFTIYVTGLSNGYVKAEDTKGETIMRRKTLQLKFSKPGDEFNPREDEIRFIGNPEWVYR